MLEQLPLSPRPVLLLRAQGFVDPHKFDPERFNEERKEDLVYRRNWLLFGAGPHQVSGPPQRANTVVKVEFVGNM